MVLLPRKKYKRIVEADNYTRFHQKLTRKKDFNSKIYLKQLS